MQHRKELEKKIEIKKVDDMKKIDEERQKLRNVEIEMQIVEKKMQLVDEVHSEIQICALIQFISIPVQRVERDQGAFQEVHSH